VSVPLPDVWWPAALGAKPAPAPKKDTGKAKRAKVQRVACPELAAADMRHLRQRGAPIDPVPVQPAYRPHRGGGVSGVGRRRHRPDRGALRLFGHRRA
jgi:hypothetical protein